MVAEIPQITSPVAGVTLRDAFDARLKIIARSIAA
jgi:hypothetical protein